MTGFVGMDVEAVQQLAVQLDQRSTQLRDLAHTLDSMVQQLQGAWHGHDATTFAGWWQQQHRPALLACMEAIHGLAQSARNNATDQTGASGGSGSGQGPAPLLTPAPSQHGHAGPPAPGGPDNPGGVWPEDRSKLDVKTGYDAWAKGYWADPNGGQYQCTSWALYRWHELGYNLPDKAFGDGWAMAGNVATTVGEPISTQPTLHAMASYGDGVHGNHVMIVEQVQDDGGIRVSEMNTDSDWRHASASEFMDSHVIPKGPDGLYKVDGHELRFAAFPG